MGFGQREHTPMSRERACGGSIDQRFALSRAITVFTQDFDRQPDTKFTKSKLSEAEVDLKGILWAEVQSFCPTHQFWYVANP
jgi:hypothetical protein